MHVTVARLPRPDRRATELLAQLRARLAAEPSGLLSVHDLMQACVARYYSRGDVLGRAGDFVTAPEISQIFGELIGLWCGVVWQQMGSPPAFNLVELGPGRGTMLRDALRALRLLPGYLAAARVHLIEPSAALRAQQTATLADFAASLSWVESIGQVSCRPTIVVGNEYVDALPVHQAVFQQGRWRTRCVRFGPDGNLDFAVGTEVTPPGGLPVTPDSRPGAVIEWRDPGPDLSGLTRLSGHGLAVLLIDYGHTVSGRGDTLQAVRRHAFEHPLCSPGEADITAQVDFAALGRQLSALGLRASSPLSQAAFLSSLGITERAARLMNANPQHANAIEMAVGRLLSPSGMGNRFQVIGAASPGLPPLPGLSA